MYKKVKWKNGILTDNKAEEIPRNKLCVYLIGPYKIFSKRKKEKVSLKSATMINPIMVWFEIM